MYFFYIFLVKRVKFFGLQINKPVLVEEKKLQKPGLHIRRVQICLTEKKNSKKG